MACPVSKSKILRSKVAILWVQYCRKKAKIRAFNMDGLLDVDAMGLKLNLTVRWILRCVLQEGKIKITDLQKSMSNLDLFEKKLTDHYNGSQKSIADTHAVS